MVPPNTSRPTSDLPTLKVDNSGHDSTVTINTHVAASLGKPQVRQVPEVIAGYRRLRQLGAGGMGEVHLAHHDRLDRKVALKLLRPNVSDDGDFTQRFLRESKAMAAVSHPNVVAIHDAGEADGFLFMAIEFVDGTDLSKQLKTRGTIDEPTALGILIGCCRGLEAIYEAGLVHRDIKPANIFLDREGKPKIGDLGLARHVDGEDRMTMTGSAWGTPAYMPPEQLRGVADIDIRADLYALGATLYTILTGSEPFTGPTSFVITSRILSEPSPDPRLLNRTVSGAVTAIIRACLEKDRAKRYPDPATLRLDLERARDGLPLAFAHAVGGDASADGAKTPAGPLAGARPRETPAMAAARVPSIDPMVAKLVAYAAGAAVLVLVIWSLQGGTQAADRPRATPAAANDPALAAAPVSRSWMKAQGRDQAGEWATIAVGSAALRLRRVPAGQFRMGSPPEEPGRGPTETPHTVVLSGGFWMGETEVTRAQWQAVMGDAPAADRRPIDGVSWFDADQFTKALNNAVPGLAARLPTEAEWEYACRAGSPEAFCGGPQPEPGEWLEQPGKGPREVAKGMANRFGLLDMHGNVREWCLDDWDGTTPLPASEEHDPRNRLGSLAALRGGSWNLPVARGRSAARSAGDPQDRIADAGLRIVVDDR